MVKSWGFVVGLSSDEGGSRLSRVSSGTNALIEEMQRWRSHYNGSDTELEMARQDRKDPMKVRSTYAGVWDHGRFIIALTCSIIDRD